MNIKKITSSSIFASLLTSLSALSLASTFISPQAILQEGQEFPGFGTEGLHIARFTIQADGTTSDIEVVGGFTNEFAGPYIRDVVRGWTYEPGTYDGEPIDFYNQEFILRARLFDEMVITTNVQEGADNVRVLVEERDFDGAQQVLDGLLESGLQSVSDYALLHELKASIYMAMEDSFEALESSRKATISTINLEGETEFMLTPDVLESALRKQVHLAASVGQNSTVIKAFEILKSNFEITENDSLLQLANSSRAALESPEPLGLLAKIIEDKWTYAPARRTFAVTNVIGEIDKINVRCERRNLELEFEVEVEWSLPESFGKCQLDFVGRDNTEFTVYEFVE